MFNRVDEIDLKLIPIVSSLPKGDKLVCQTGLEAGALNSVFSSIQPHLGVSMSSYCFCVSPEWH